MQHLNVPGDRLGDAPEPPFDAAQSLEVVVLAGRVAVQGAPFGPFPEGTPQGYLTLVSRGGYTYPGGVCVERWKIAPVGATRGPPRMP